MDEEKLLKTPDVAPHNPRRWQAKVNSRKAAQSVDKSLVDLESTQREPEQADSCGSSPQRRAIAKSHRSQVWSPTLVEGGKIEWNSQAAVWPAMGTAMPLESKPLKSRPLVSEPAKRGT